MTSQDPSLDDAFPEHHATLRIETEGSEIYTFPNELYSGEFYPFNSSGTDPVFAFAWGRNTIICRPSSDPEKGFEVVRWFKDEDVNASLWSVVWSQDSDTGDPLICVSGEPAKIKVLNVKTGELVTTLVGHGARVNMLALSPVSSNIVASTSDDNTVRLWNLSHPYRRDPCRAMLAGWGHKAEVLCMAFHHTGRYVISGGNDTRICLWVLPDLTETGNDQPTDKTTIVYYPHFVTEEIHPHLVDCVGFYGDFILSKCLNPPHGKILLWRIVGFSSNRESPPLDSAPTASSSLEETRSAFCSKETIGNGAFQVLLSFDMPNVLYHGHCFGLYHQPQEHPVLAVGNSSHWICFWDLQLLEQGLLGDAPLKLPRSKKPTKPDTTTGLHQEKFTGPFSKLKPHKAIHVPSSIFQSAKRETIRSVSWSVGGEWCVALGDDGLVCLMRWPAKEKKRDE